MAFKKTKNAVMHGHEPDTAKTKKSAVNSDPINAGAQSHDVKIVRPASHIGKYHKYLGHMQKAEYVNQGHNVTPMGLPSQATIGQAGSMIGGRANRVGFAPPGLAKRPFGGRGRGQNRGGPVGPPTPIMGGGPL